MSNGSFPFLKSELCYHLIFEFKGSLSRLVLLYDLNFEISLQNCIHSSFEQKIQNPFGVCSYGKTNSSIMLYRKFLSLKL